MNGAGPPADAPPDADPHGLVHVTVLDIIGNGAPAPNIPVIFVDPDGTTSDVVTDANGRASATVLPGASVSAIYQQFSTSSSTTGTVTTTTNTTRYSVASVLDIKPGDDLPIGFTDRDGTQSGTFNVQFTANPSATSYTIFTPCGSSTGSPGVTNQVQFQAGCQQDTFDLYVLANDAAGKPAFGAITTDVQLASGGATIPNTYIATGAFSAALSDIPADVTSVGINRLSGANRFGFSSGGTCTISSGACSLSLPQVPTVTPKSVVRTTVSRSSNANSLQAYQQRVGGNNLNYTLDLATNLLPWMSGATWDQATQAVVPTLEAPIDDAIDAVLAETTYGRSSSVTGGDGNITVTQTNIDWFLMGPSAAPIVHPTLPGHVGPVQMLDGDNGGIMIVVAMDSSNRDGWDAARARAFDFVEVINNENGTDDVFRFVEAGGSFTPMKPLAPETAPVSARVEPYFLKR